MSKGKKVRTMDPRARIHAKTAISESGCWLWVGYVRADGYVKMKFGGEEFYAHRFAYEAFKGPIPPGYDVDHLCRIRHCSNPDHLEAVTPHENKLRMVPSRMGKGRKVGWRAKFCKRGHELTHENTHASRNKSRNQEYRRCNECERIRREKYRERLAH